MAEADLPGSDYIPQAQSLDLRSFTSRIATCDSVSTVMRSLLVLCGMPAADALAQLEATLSYLKATAAVAG